MQTSRIFVAVAFNLHAVSFTVATAFFEECLVLLEEPLVPLGKFPLRLWQPRVLPQVLLRLLQVFFCLGQKIVSLGPSVTLASIELQRFSTVRFPDGLEAARDLLGMLSALQGSGARLAKNHSTPGPRPYRSSSRGTS